MSFRIYLSQLCSLLSTLYSGPSTKWFPQDIAAAVSEIQGGLSYCEVDKKYGIPKSTLQLYVIGKIEVGSRPGPPTIFTTVEEEKVVQYVIEISHIGYGCTKRQVQDMVKKFLDQDGCPSPFANNRPGEKWWKLFIERHPELSLRQPEHLQLSRARCTTPEAIRSWFVTFEQFLVENGVKDSPYQN